MTLPDQIPATYDELARQLAGRAPIFWHEPLLLPGHTAWHTETLPIVMVATDIWDGLLEQFRWCCDEFGCAKCRGQS